ILAQNNAEFGHYREMEKKAKLYGLNVSYQSDFNRLIRQETEQTLLATQAKNQLTTANRQLSFSARSASAAIGLAKGALALVGGPFGAAMLAGSALLYFHQQANDARQSAINLKDAVVETTAALMQLSDKQLAVKEIDYRDKLDSQLEEQRKLQDVLKYMNKQIDQSNKQGWIGDVFGNKSEMDDARKRAEENLESVNKGIQKTRDNLVNVGKAKFLVKNGIADYANQLASDIKTITASTKSEIGQDTPSTPWTGQDGDGGKGQKAKANQYEQLRREIEAVHASSLGRINLQEQESARKLLEAARADGASEADIQKTLLLNAENYQKKRLELAEQYAPVRASLNKEREASWELKSLLDARLLTEKEYQ
ncbi:phage tail tape measure protein, partial [Salmonella enterica subsp. enterica serovar Lattenkamp]|nr:phage tail tape measure protein [Salmonella enterica subsp. enterica serovar Lattenkamp]